MAKLNVVLAGGVFVAALALGLIVTTPIAVAAQGTKSAAPAAKMDLNAASQAELEKLPGVGEATGRSAAAPTGLARRGQAGRARGGARARQ